MVEEGEEGEEQAAGAGDAGGGAGGDADCCASPSAVAGAGQAVTTNGLRERAQMAPVTSAAAAAAVAAGQALQRGMSGRARSKRRLPPGAGLGGGVGVGVGEAEELGALRAAAAAAAADDDLGVANPAVRTMDSRGGGGDRLREGRGPVWSAVPHVCVGGSSRLLPPCVCVAWLPAPLRTRAQSRSNINARICRLARAP